MAKPSATTPKLAISKRQAAASIVVGVFCAIVAVWILGSGLEPSMGSLGSSSPSPPPPPPSSQSNSSSDDLRCEDQSYKTELISLDPLVIYIRDFLNSRDIEGILKIGEGRFNPSVVNQGGKLIQDPYRTSWSAALPAEDPAVKCVLERSRSFLGTVLDPDEDEMGVPQLVRYTAGQEYNLHHDWMRMPQAAFDGSPRTFNRVASFFVTLQDNCTEGETWFPFIKAVSPQPKEADGSRLWREHADGGLAFRPIAGNGIFWVNLFPNGTGDTRTVHAGLPVTSGLKTAMNIWPRQYRPIK
ncbi:putative 2OG-Fe oxygenase family Oxidoreductase [Rosellinia necatrix]|uniref:Putative 2OG-Fe oxygenase family Oxidoreductase n=1 Tax=Rosellinia necatrix TaxID=77044 RepID=A0A1W2TSU0_ROSNE|nr:putative 2OG-Fe oxygenase family Oxidoreductase [Rosellinia necatrix]